jgi:pSer/pThr/pTyr-binding forkhead associated (FHA) protein/outer membrane biosynthesis protein TonB
VINHESVSAVHAVIEIFDDRAILYDMNSTNGTYVEDERIIVKEIRLNHSFRISDLEFIFGSYDPVSALPPVLDTLEPQKGEASIISSIREDLSSVKPDKKLPSSAPLVDSKLPSIIYPLAADPKAEFSEYIFEDRSELYPIFKYEVNKQSVEVIILFKDQVYSVDYLPESKIPYQIAGLSKSQEEINFPYLGKKEKLIFIEASAASTVVHTLPGFGVFFLSDKKKDTGHVATSIEIRGNDLVRFHKDDLQIFVRNVQSPPKIASAPILKRDPEFRKYLLFFMVAVGFLCVGLNVVEVPEDKSKEELAPERLATILYRQKLTVSNKPAVEMTPKAKPIAQQAPNKPAVERKVVQDNTPVIKKPDIIETKDQSKKPDPGKKTATEKKVVKQGTQPVTKPSPQKVSSPVSQTKSTTMPTTKSGVMAQSNFEAKTQGHVEVYKSADFKSTVSSLVAKGGSLSGVKTASSSSGTSSIVGAMSGVSSGSGQLKTADIATNQGSLVGAATGELGESKGAEGLSAKRAIYTAGIPSETVVLGSMDPDVIRRRLMEFLPQFRSCYQRELEQKGNEISGVVKLNFVIGSSGHVMKAGIDGSTPLPRDVSGCVLNVLRGITFPEPMGGGKVEVNQPMSFQPKRI